MAPGHSRLTALAKGAGLFHGDLGYGRALGHQAALAVL